MAIAGVVGPQLDAGTPRRGIASTQREAFECFPYGLLVLDGRGRLVCANREASRLIAAAGLPETGLTCCALLACGVADTALEGHCLTELAVRNGHVLPEMRIDTRASAGAGSMWITASPIGGGDDARVVVQLRPARPDDRRRHAAPNWTAGPLLRIRTLGATVVESPDGPIDGAWLDQRTGQLFKYLIAERRRAVTVDEIGESIWREADYAVGTSVRYYVHALRRKLEPTRGLREPSAFISASCGTYRLALDHVSLDADEFEAGITAGIAAAQRDPAGAAEDIERSLTLYRGDFLADLPYAEWAMAERHRLHELACIGLRRLTDIRLERRALDGAARALERLATLQPFDEDVHRRLMEIDIARGRRSDAVRRYATLRCRLRRTFGHDPDFTPADLARPRV
jgi:DNA-binding SARP family transcriptional activator